MGRDAHFKGLCVLIRACVGVGEPAEALALPGRSCAHDAEATDNGGTPTSCQRLDQKLKVPLISGTLSHAKPGTT